jgi:hypothetical protein
LVLQGFNKNLQVAKSLLKNKIILSFGAKIINNKKSKDVILAVFLDKFYQKLAMRTFLFSIFIRK